MRLSWKNGAAYDSISVYRERAQVKTLSGTATSWLDVQPPPGTSFYRLVAHGGGLSSTGVICEPGTDRPFLRGDVEENGELNLTDAVVILGFLFLGNAQPDCLDAADVDDSGTILITDGINLLQFLFLSGAPPRPPFPLAGYDPTLGDGLECR